MNYYISTARYKCALVCIAGAVIIAVNELLMGMSVSELLITYGIAVAFLLIMGFFLWRPAYVYASSDAAKLWDKWGIYGKRGAEAAEVVQAEDVKFERVYKKTKYGLLKDPSKGYRIATTLTSCTCMDFRKNRIPCKHMYKLADILGVYEKPQK